MLQALAVQGFRQNQLNLVTDKAFSFFCPVPSKLTPISIGILKIYRSFSKPFDQKAMALNLKSPDIQTSLGNA